MKSIYYLIATLVVCYSCVGGGGESKVSIETQFDLDLIDDLFTELKVEYETNEDANLAGSYNYGELIQFSGSKNDVVSSYALSRLDSVNNFIDKLEEKQVLAIKNYAKEQGWDKLDSEVLKELEKNLKVKSDEFSTTTIYRHPSSPKFVNFNGFFMLISDYGADEPLVLLRSQYKNDDWLFINSAKISVDGEIFSLNVKEWERDNSGGYIFEWGDVKLKKFDLVIAVVEGDNVKIRFTGDQYYDDRTVTSDQKAALKEMMKFYYLKYLMK